MTKRLLLILASTLGLAACSNGVQVPNQTPNKDKAANIALSEAARSVSHSMASLEATEQASSTNLVATPPNPATYEMNMLASVDWQGPVEPILRKLVHMTTYKLVISGQKPPLPIMVSLSVKNEMVGTIIRNLGLQCKNQANIVVMPASKTVELRYQG